MEQNLQQWQRRLQEMKDCKSIAGLSGQCGEPHHKVQRDGFEIWHYPLGIESGKLYSIHVAVAKEQVSQVYLHFEPASDGDSPAQRPWWKFW